MHKWRVRLIQIQNRQTSKTCHLWIKAPRLPKVVTFPRPAIISRGRQRGISVRGWSSWKKRSVFECVSGCLGVGVGARSSLWGRWCILCWNSCSRDSRGRSAHSGPLPRVQHFISKTSALSLLIGFKMSPRLLLIFLISSAAFLLKLLLSLSHTHTYSLTSSCEGRFQHCQGHKFHPVWLSLRTLLRQCFQVLYSRLV